MKTIDLKLETINKAKTGFISGNITAVNKVINIITKLNEKSKTIAKKAYKELEKHGSAASYAIHR